MATELIEAFKEETMKHNAAAAAHLFDPTKNPDPQRLLFYYMCDGRQMHEFSQYLKNHYTTKPVPLEDLQGFKHDSIKSVQMYVWINQSWIRMDITESNFMGAFTSVESR